MATKFYRCANYGQCGSEFETAAERDTHEHFCTYEPPPDPEPESQPKAS